MKFRLSVIIPVLNEAHIINRTLLHLQNARHALAFEVILVDGDPSGATLDTVADKAVQKIKAPRGRGAQMHRGAQLAAGDVLLFMHADTVLGEEALRQVLAACRRKDIDGGAFSLGIDSGRCVFRLIEKAVSIRSRLTKIPYGDQAIFLKKAIYHQLGGFRDIPLMEDVDLMRRLKKAGGRTVLLPEKTLTSPRRWQNEGIVRCTLRNWLLIGLYLGGVSPQRLARFYR